MIHRFTESRKDRLLHEQIHDPYKAARKPKESSVCPVCRAVFKDGRWQWLAVWSLDAHKEICEACRRIRDNYPAGFLILSGEFLKTHREGIFHLVRHQELDEVARHPLHRIIGIEEHPNRVVVATTDIHLPKRIGRAVHRAYKGRIRLHYDKEGCFVRANWISNDSQGGKQSAKKRGEI